MNKLRWVVLCLLVPILGACSHWSWNPRDWFGEKPEPAPAPVELLSIQSTSADAAGERFVQSWEGARLVVDIYSGSGIGHAVVKPRDKGWPLKLAFRLNLAAVEDFEFRGAQNLRWSLGREPLPQPALIDIPHGAYQKDTPQIEIEWVDHYR